MFQLNTNNLINLNDYVIINSDDEIEFDDELREFINSSNIKKKFITYFKTTSKGGCRRQI